MINSFIDFLKNSKGFINDNFLKDVHLVDTVGSQGVEDRYLCDLVILDTNNNNYLALIDFKSDMQSLRKISIENYKRYLTVLNKPNLLFYFVVADKLNDFKIFIIENNNLKAIDKSDFPNYKTLISKVKADEKDEIRNQYQKKKTFLERRKQILNSTIYSILTSLFIGLFISYLLKPGIFENKNKFVTESRNCCDSIQFLEKKINTEIFEINRQLLMINQNDSIKKPIENIQFQTIKKRVNNIENLLSKNPENLLKFQDLNFNLETIKTAIKTEKEISEIKLKNLQDKFDFFVGVMVTSVITIIGAIVGFGMSALRKQ